MKAHRLTNREQSWLELQLRCCFSKLQKSFFASVLLLATNSAFAVTINDVTGGVTPAQMEAVLTGTGVTVTNLVVTNPAGCNSTDGVGIFTNGTTGGAGPVLSEPTGIVIGSGAIAGGNRLDSSNDSRNVLNFMCGGAVSDVDMVAIEPQTNNGEYAAIEFDVVPQFTTLALPFQFGSDEFPEYVCSNFNDIVGIFVSGPGIAGAFRGTENPPSLNAENYAKTAGGDLSSINWVNTGIVGQNGNPANCGSLLNTAFYTDNSSGDLLGGNGTVAGTNTNLEMDGYTNTLFQPITVIAGQSYHVKIAVADAGDRQWDSSAYIHPIFSTGTFSGFDYGDAPDSYRTLTSNGGPSHGVDNTIFMGAGVPDNEVTGIPSVNADGDDLDNADDEDSVNSFPTLLTSDTTYSVNVSVTNNSGSPARLIGWIDFNGNGTFEASEGTLTNVANGTTGATVALNWTGLAGLVAGDTYVRLRFSSDLSLATSTPGSAMSDGEVEDYPISILGVNFDKYVSTNATCTDMLDAITVGVSVNVYYCYVVSNPGTQSFTINPGNTSDSLGHDLSGLEQAYAAGVSQSVIVGPIVAGSAQLPTASTTNNTAQVTATFAGPINIVDNEAASVDVNPVVPASGIKQLYFDLLNTGAPNLTRVVPAANTQTGNIDTLTLDQGILFQSPFTITGGSTVNIQIRMRRRNGGGNRDVQVDLINGGTGAIIGTNTVSWNAGGWQTLTASIPIAADVTFAATDFVRVVLNNIPASNGNIQVRTLQGAVRSEVQMQTSTVINVDSIVVFDAPFASTAQFSSYRPGSAVSIRATVSDPFGSVDINPTGATITVVDSATNTVVNNQAMTSVSTPSGELRVFEYLYNIPAAPAPDGFWTISVTANEGTEGTISHTGPGTMIVGDASAVLLKSSVVISDPVNLTNPKAIPNSVIEYTVTATNTGFGYVDLDRTFLTDPIPPQTTLFLGNPADPAQFFDGATTSGLTYTFTSLGSTTDDIAFSNDGGGTFITPLVDAAGFDITVPPINFIEINPKGEFSGSDGVNNPSFSMTFRVRVD